MLALALIVVQWASPRPILPRTLLVMLALPTSAGLLLSLSRASWLGLAAGLLLVATLRYRRILVLGAIVGLALLVSAQGQEFIARFISGFSTADRATAFRFGEYANALTLLQRYPFLGIGFGLSPDIDVTAGVSERLPAGRRTDRRDRSDHVRARPRRHLVDRACTGSPTCTTSNCKASAPHYWRPSAAPWSPVFSITTLPIKRSHMLSPCSGSMPRGWSP